MNHTMSVTDLSTGRTYQVRTQDTAHAKAMALAMRSASLRMGRAIARDMAETRENNRGWDYLPAALKLQEVTS